MHAYDLPFATYYKKGEFYSPLVASFGTRDAVVKLYFQRDTGELYEGLWDVETKEWSFHVIIEKGIVETGAAITGTTSQPWKNHLFYKGYRSGWIENSLVMHQVASPENLRPHAGYMNSSDAVGAISFLDRKANPTVPNLRFYHAIGTYFREWIYGADGQQTWKLGGEIKPTSVTEHYTSTPAACYNRKDWVDETGPSICLYYLNSKKRLNEMNYDNGSWCMGTLDAEAADFEPYVDRITGATSITWIDDKGVKGKAIERVFVTESSLIRNFKRVNGEQWNDFDDVFIRAMSDEKDDFKLPKGGFIAAASPQEAHGQDDFHFFASGENGTFHHWIFKNGEWEKNHVDPFAIEEEAKRKEAAAAASAANRGSSYANSTPNGLSAREKPKNETPKWNWPSLVSSN
ncbi:hypothetical protein TWF694_008130 [Orbilia ellipsospora]|uniref:Fucose-specific lectin n=1 Tax=Orbilia ellipsospora TaxID=2528407 RepID=A0AAV9XFT7_9PEZI